MKITKSYLRKIIKEEARYLLEVVPAPDISQWTIRGEPHATDALPSEPADDSDPADDLTSDLITAIIAKFGVTEEEAQKVGEELDEIVYWIRKGGIQ